MQIIIEQNIINFPQLEEHLGDIIQQLNYYKTIFYKYFDTDRIWGVYENIDEKFW